MRSVESLSLSIIRLAEEHAMKDNTAQVLIQAPPEIANYLLNEKRRALVEIETRHDAPIIVVADDQLETPHFNVSRLRDGETGEEVSKPSYHRTSPRKLEVHALTKAHMNVPDLPAVTHVAPSQPAPVREPREEVAIVDAPARLAAAPASRGFFAWLKSLFASSPQAAPAPANRPRSDRPDRDGRGDRDRGERGGSRGNDARRGRGAKPDGSRSAGAGAGGGGGGGGNRQQAQAKSQQQTQAAPKPDAQQPAKGQPRGEPRGEPRPERTEEQKALDEQRRLEQQKKETERRELQRQENIKRETERRAAREARLAAQAAETGGEVSAIDAESNGADAVAEAVALADGTTPAVAGAEGAAGEGGRRRRGRRGGRRRRRQDGSVAGEPGSEGDGDSTASQSEIDFDDEEEGEEQTSIATTSISPVASSAPVIASSFAVTSAESDFDDLPMADEPAPAPVAVAFVAPTAPVAPTAELPVVEAAIDAAPAEAGVAAAVVSPLSTPSVSEVYSIPVEPIAVPPMVSMTIEPMPPEPIVVAEVEVRDDVPLMAVEPEAIVVRLPEFDPVVQIADPELGMADETDIDGSTIAEGETVIRNTPAV